MKFKKSVFSLTLIAATLLIYNSLDVVKAEEQALPEVPQSEVSPFDEPENSVTTTTTTTTTTVTDEKIKIEDIEPAILKEMTPDVKEVVQTTTTVKEQVDENGEAVEIRETEVNTLKIDENGVTDTIEKEVTTEEIKKEELPVLEEIQLPEVTKKPENNEPVKVEISSQQIPVGTVIPLRLESQINTISASMGDQFNATLISDIMINDKIVLPAGSVVRGTVGSMRKAGLFMKEGKIMLIFDHIVTPAGKQIPMYAYLAHDTNINYEGYIVGGTSYSKAFKKDAVKGKSILVDTTTLGVDTGLKYWGGVPVVITAPVCAIGGALGGGGYIVGKTVYNMFVKGDDVMLESGTPLNVTLSKALDIPVN